MQLGDAGKTRWNDFVLCSGWQFAAAIAHKNNDIENFTRILLQTPQTHAITARINPRLVMNGSFDAGERFHHAILQPPRSRESKTGAVAVSR